MKGNGCAGVRKRSLKAGPFCSSLMVVQNPLMTAFGNRGRFTISLNYRIVRRGLFV